MRTPPHETAPALRRAAWLLGAGVAVGCVNFDLSGKNHCRSQADCVDGYVCRSERCLPIDGATADSGGPTLLWSDEFDTLDLASSAHPTGLWRVGDATQGLDDGYRDLSGTNWNINPARAPYDGSSPFSVSDGVLRISATRTPTALESAIADDMAAQGVSGGVPTWCSGHLALNPAVRQLRYGYVEFRVRWPNPGKGMFPALWFFSAAGANPPSHARDEIDLLEIFGRATGQPWETTVSPTATGSRVLGEQTTDTKDWHTYGLDWQPASLRFYRDGVQLYEETGEAAAAFDGASLSIRFDLAMDAAWFASIGAASDSSTPDPMFMDLDSIRVYTSKP